MGDRAKFFKYFARKRKPQKEVEITLRLKMTEQQAKLWLQSSLERVINSSLEIIDSQAGPDEHDFTYINVEDWEEWKGPIVHVWTAIHNEIFAKLSGMQSDRTYSL